MSIQKEIRGLELELALLRADAATPTRDASPLVGRGMAIGFTLGLIVGFAFSMFQLSHVHIGMGGG